MTLHPQATLDDVAWLRDLARQLVRDHHRADDLAQDAWVAALGHGQSRIVNLRAWLATTLRNRVRLGCRQQQRELSRQAAVARPEAIEGTDALLVRVQQQRAVLVAVERLAEPSRTAILLRFVEGLPPRAIAARLGVPVATVQTRLKRGLERLRCQLDGNHGSRAAWVAMLAPWAKRSSGSWFFGSMLLMHTHLKIGLAAVLLASAAGLYLSLRPTSPEVAPTSMGEAAAPGVELTATPTAEVPTTPRREALDPVTSGSQAAPVMPAPPPGRIVRGRALRLDGMPLAQVQVARRGGEERVTTDLDGSFTLPLGAASQGGEVEVADPAWTTVFYGDATSGEAAARIVVAAPRRALRGRVVDEDGRGIARASARIWLPPSLRAGLPLVLDYSTPRSWSATTRDDGQFAWEECAQLPGVDVELTCDGYRPARHPLALGMNDVRIVLTRPRPGDDAISGCVLGPQGILIAGAYVAAGGASTITDQRGEFTLLRTAIADSQELTAVAAGLLPARVPVPASSEYVKLQLHGEAQSLAGVVVDREQRPMPRCKVWVADPSYFGTVDQLMVTAEGMTAAAISRTDLDALWQELATLSEDERAARMPPDRAWSFCRTDAEGRFRIEGLAARAYRVRALDERTLLMAEAGPFLAGAEDVRLQLPTDQLWPTLSGRVLDTHGQPMPGARLQVRVGVLQIGTASSWVRRGQTRDRVTADAQGRFTLRDVPMRSTLWVSGDDLETLEFGAGSQRGLQDKVQDASALEIVVRRRCHFRVELLDPGSANAFEILDAQGKRMQITRIEGTSTYSNERPELHDGKSPVLNVLEEARTLVLLKGSQEVRRLDLTLFPGRESLITP